MGQQHQLLMIRRPRNWRDCMRSIWRHFKNNCNTDDKYEAGASHDVKAELGVHTRACLRMFSICLRAVSQLAAMPRYLA
jgi:hypothetical protein